MKTRLSIILAVVLLISSFFVTGAYAATGAEPVVRVNGFVVSFPDTQPYIDANNRTMIPVRSATEALGATVSWDEKTSTATISKNGISVAITIGSSTLAVTKADGTKTSVTMDTIATITGDRTCVPIRFVAEALGAYVDYSDVYATVGIYNDVLSAVQITKLRSYPYTHSIGAVSLAYSQSTLTAAEVTAYYGTDRANFSGTYGYANAREHIYNIGGRRCYASRTFKILNQTISNKTNEQFYDYVVKEALADIAYDSTNVTFGFIADSSCVYQEDNMDITTATVRGIITMTPKVNPASFTGTEMTARFNFGLNGAAKAGGTYYVPVDIHMNTVNSTVYMKTVVPLDDQYTA